MAPSAASVDLTEEEGCVPTVPASVDLTEEEGCPAPCSVDPVPAAREVLSEEEEEEEEEGGCWPRCLRRGSGPGELEESSFVNAQGLRIATYVIRAEDPVAVCVLVHGYKVTARYEWLAPTREGGPHVRWRGSFLERLHAAGVSVFACDQQSHGDSEGVHGAVEDVGVSFDSLDDLARDVIQLADEAAAQYPALPRFLVGSSMGGAAVVRAAQLVPDAERFAGVVAQSPMLYMNGYRRSWYRSLALLMLDVALWAVGPTGETISSEGNLIASHDDEVKTEPKFYEGKMRATTLVACAGAMHRFMEEGGLEAPFRADSLLVLHSTKDTKCPLDGSEALFARARCPRKTLAVFAGIGKAPEETGRLEEAGGVDSTRIFPAALLDLPLFHNLVREPGGGPVATAVATWLRKEADRAAAQ